MCLKRISPSLGFRRIIQLFNKHVVSGDESTKDLVKSLLRLNQKKRLSLDKVPRRRLKPALETTALVPPSHKSSTPGIRAISDTSISWKMSFPLPTFVPQQLYIGQDLGATILCSNMDLLCCFTSQHGIQIDRMLL